MSNEMTAKDWESAKAEAEESQRRLMELLGDERMVALAVGVQGTLADAAIHMSRTLATLLGEKRAEKVVLGGLREAAKFYENAIAFADRKTQS